MLPHVPQCLIDFIFNSFNFNFDNSDSHGDNNNVNDNDHYDVNGKYSENKSDNIKIYWFHEDRNFNIDNSISSMRDSMINFDELMIIYERGYIISKIN